MCKDQKEADPSVLAKAYKRDPSIANYVKLRRENPAVSFEVAVIGGIDDLFAIEQELQKFGIDTDLVLGAMDADQNAVSELSLQLLERIVEVQRRKDAGETQLVRRGLATPDKLIDWIICCALDAMSWNDDLQISRDLIVLIRERLGGSDPEYKQLAKTHKRKGDAAILGGQLLARGITPTYQMIGAVLGVAPSTVKRWFKDGEFARQTELWSRSFDREGNLIPLGQLRKSVLRSK